MPKQSTHSCISPRVIGDHYAQLFAHLAIDVIVSDPVPRDDAQSLRLTNLVFPDITNSKHCRQLRSCSKHIGSST